MDDPGFVKHFVAAERPGFYCRVIQPGVLLAGDRFTLQRPPDAPADAGITTLDIFRARYRRLTGTELRRFLAAPIDERTRSAYQRELSGRDPANPD
jgi:MOSC domain-containing protein YiiM